MASPGVLLRRLRAAASGNRIETAPKAADPRLRGRDYDIAYAHVYEAVRSIARTMPGSTVVEEDGVRGTLRAEARSPLGWAVDEVTVHVSLAPSGRTRVDLGSASCRGRAELGANARRVGAFLPLLDRPMAIGPPRRRLTRPPPRDGVVGYR